MFADQSVLLQAAQFDHEHVHFGTKTSLLNPEGVTFIAGLVFSCRELVTLFAGESFWLQVGAFDCNTTHLIAAWLVSKRDLMAV